MARLTFVRRVGRDDRLSIVEHLDELRRRLFVCAGALVLAFIAMYIIHEPLMEFLKRPLPDEQPGLVTFAVSEAFFTVLKVSAYAALIVALPIWLYQLYAFIIPAVGDQSRRRMLITVAGISALFLAGAAFGFFIVLPVAVDWLLSFGDDLFVNQLRAADYYSFVSMFTLASGLMFEVPIAMAGLAMMGIVQADFYTRNWRFAVVIIAFLAAALPGGDPMSMMLLMAPQIILYAVGVWLARLLGRDAPWKEWSDAGEADRPASTT